MSKLVKSHWGVSGNHVQVTVPFAKVDEERRLVSGFATLDNLDSQGDIVTAEASQKAFARARGNIREMHQPIAAGKLVDFREDVFYDPESAKFYRGIFVTAYVSKGAQATWEKVLDGTLTGFSIGGEIKESDTEYIADLDKTVRFVKDYELIELSLVDNPANSLANVFSFQKSAEGSVTLKGMVADTSVENVFWCGTDNVARTSDTDNADCLICGTTMANIGWVETGAERTEKVREVVTKFLAKDAAEDASEGGVTVEKENKETPEVVEQNAETAENAEVVDESREATADNAETPEEASEEKQVEANEEVVAENEEVHDESEELQKRMEDLRTSIDDSLAKTREEATTAVSALEEKIVELTKSIEAKFSEFEEKFGELDKSLATEKSSLADLQKSLDKINSSGAIKKSGEVEKSNEPERVQKDDDWNGAFSVKSLFK